MWMWENEILFGFAEGTYKNLGDRHHIDRDAPERHWFARSLDGGETWNIEKPANNGFPIAEGDALHGIETPGLEIPEWKDCPGGVDFTHPDFAMTLRMTDVNKGPSRFYYSYDRGHNWEGPFRLPDMGLPGIAARTDYQVLGKHEAIFFLTAAKKNGKEGIPFCARTTDGCKTFEFISYIGEEPKGYAIMPGSVRLGEDEYFVAVRQREGDDGFISGYRSTDGCKTWTLEHPKLVQCGAGNPPSLIKLADGRLCLTYGHRAEPYYSIRRIFSEDNGKTWEPIYTIRSGGDSTDIGYVRSLQRPDGKVVTTYYFNDAESVGGPERFVAASIWLP
jgi:hypothetical protein